MPEDYGYGNARLRAMRSRLLNAATYETLLDKTSVDEVLAGLAQTPYKTDLEAALARFDGLRALFEALRRNLTNVLRKLQGFYDGQAGALVSLLLHRWDRHNLLAILRGQSRGISADTITAELIPVGQLDQVSLRELARQPDLRAAIDLMTVWGLPYSDALRQTLAGNNTQPRLDQLELVLNRAHYTTLKETLGQGNGNRAIVREHLRVEVDLLNLRTLLRLASRPDLAPLVRERYDASDVSPLLIEVDGALSARKLAALVAEVEGVETLVQALSDTPYGDALAIGLERYQATGGGIMALERALERWQVRGIARMFTQKPLSITIPIAYLALKETEVANLRLIAQAASLEMKRRQVEPYLIL